MKRNWFEALALFVLALALSVPPAFKLGTWIAIAMHHNAPPTWNYADDATLSADLTDQDRKDAILWCELMENMRVSSTSDAKRGEEGYADYEQQILNEEIRTDRTDPRDPSTGIYSKLVKQFAYNYRHRDAETSRSE